MLHIFSKYDNTFLAGVPSYDMVSRAAVANKRAGPEWDVNDRVGLCTTLGKVGNVTEVCSPAMVICRNGYDPELASRQRPTRYELWKERLAT